MAFPQNPKVSIITVCFNSSRFIQKNINSVNKQSYENIEHIFVDGQSIDNTLEIIKENSFRDSKLISDEIAYAYLQMHRQHRSAWSWEIELRPWVERF